MTEINTLVLCAKKQKHEVEITEIAEEAEKMEETPPKN